MGRLIHEGTRLMQMLYSVIDRAEFPPGSGTEDNPFYWYTYALPEGEDAEDCADSECPNVAHAGLVFMNEDDKERWNDKQDTDETIEADVVFYCVMHFVPAVERINSRPA